MNASATLNIALLSSEGAEADANMAGQARVGSNAHGWPPECTLAELGRILTMVHGVKAPTDSTLKKWSAAGEFRACVIVSGEAKGGGTPSSLVNSALGRPSRGGRPGLRLRTGAAIGRVYELWPFLADSDPQAVLELAVARAADHFKSAMAPVLGARPASLPASMASAEPDRAATDALRSVQEQIASLSQEMAAVRRELAQFSALRNNLITRLDDVVARAREAVTGGSASAAPGFDPLAEARRDRDMGVMKSTLSEILAALERLEGSQRSRG